MDNVVLAKLTQADVGRWVEYWPDEQIGRIKSWNGKFVFVVYHCADKWDQFQDYTAAATHQKALRFLYPTEIPNIEQEEPQCPTTPTN